MLERHIYQGQLDHQTINIPTTTKEQGIDTVRLQINKL